MLTNTYALSVLNCIAGKRNYTSNFHSGDIYIGLSSTTPTYAGGKFTEPTVSEYARVPISLGTASNGTVTTTLSYLGSAQYHDGSTDEEDTEDYWYITNTTEIKFPEATTSWGDELTHFGLFSSASVSTPFFVGELTKPITVSGTDAEGKIAIIRANTTDDGRGELIIKINAD
ncbi:MAG: hypothetical protein LUD69_07280 [Oscillospiraceae bacterium]|nr:hypothetical protein [Oscillospiraceae bacterium]